MMNYYDPFDCEICCEEVYIEMDYDDYDEEGATTDCGSQFDSGEFV